MSKPVAYRHLQEDGWEYYDAPTGEGCKECHPLYTHPVKQLSDEEMKAILLSYAFADNHGYYSIGEEHFDAIIKEITE